MGGANRTDEIEGATCNPEVSEDGSGNVAPLIVVFFATIVLIVCDFTNCFGINLSWLTNALRIGKVELGESGTSSTEADGAATGKQSLLGEQEKTQSTEASTGETTTVDDGSAPKDISFAGYAIIAFTVVPGLVGDTYFTMLAPFLPGIVHLRGMSSAMTGLIFGAQPLGSVLMAPIVPWALRQPWGDPYVFLRCSSSFTALAVCVTGLLGLIPHEETSENQLSFTIVIILMRIVQGVCSTIMGVANGQITLMLLPKDKVGPAQGIIMSTRILGVIAGPGLGGLLFEAGCWALPFTVGAILLLFSTVVLMIGLGRRAPDGLKAKEDAMSTWQLLQVPDTWVFALPMFMVCMETSLMEPAWQGFLGRAPFRLSPVEIGLFINYAVIVYMVVLLTSGFLIGIFGPAIQYLFGAIFSGFGVYLIGPSPWFGDAVPQTTGIVLLGAMLSYAGVAIFVPAMTPLGLEIFERAGFSQKQVAGVMSALNTVIISTANFAGPPLGGILIDQLGGVPWTTTVYATAVIVISSLAIVRLAKYARPRSARLAKACGYKVDDADEGDADKAKQAEGGKAA